MDPPWTHSVTSRSSVHKARQAFCYTGFRGLLAARDPDGRHVNNRLSLVDPTLYARHESVADVDWSVRHHAVAVCVHRAGDQAIVFCRLCGVSRAREWEDSYLGSAG